MKNEDISLIVAVALDGAIGHEGDMIWHLPEDLKRFKTITTGHPVIMGRKTWLSLPKRPLPGRRNIVITSNPDFCEEGAERAASPEEALAMTAGESPFIIGGATVYNTFMPRASKFYLTEIQAEAPYADTRLQLDFSDWEITEQSDIIVSEKSGVPFRYITYERKKRQ